MTEERKPGRPVTNQIVNTIPATGEEIAAAICVAADGKVKQSVGAARPPVGQRSTPPKGATSHRGQPRGGSSA